MKARFLAPLLVLGFSQVLLAAGPAGFITGNFSIDPMHSKIGFAVPHLVISSVEGRFNTFSGNLVLTNDPSKSSVTATIDPSTLDTGMTKRDEHLKSPDFFDVAKYPTITFVSKKVSFKKNEIKIVGDFTLHGVTKEVTLNGKYLGSVKDMMGIDRIAAEAKTKLNRRQYGLIWNKAIEAGPIVGDDIEITLKIEATRNK